MCRGSERSLHTRTDFSGVTTLRYVPIASWERLPAGYTHPDVAAVAVNSKGRVYLFCRAEHPVLIYERDGGFVGSWGEGMFSMRTHGITIAPDDSVWCTDDAGHSVRKFTPDGKLLLTLGDNAGKPSDSGYDGSNLTTITRGAPPFNRPTNLTVAPNGDLYISDGYGNARVHRFSPSGQLLASWGEPGTGPGQFMRAARPRGRREWRPLCRRGRLDHRRKSRSRPAGLPHRAEAAEGRLGSADRSATGTRRLPRGAS